MRTFIAVLVVLLVACAPAEPSGPPGVPDDSVAPSPDCPPKHSVEGEYGAFELDGWPIRMQMELLEEDSEFGCEVLGLLSSDLATIRAALSTDRIDRLRTVTVWIEVDEAAFPGAVYHPSAGWLVNNGYPAEWAEGIQLGNARNYLSWTETQPAMVLHEFSHAWHHQVVGYDDPTLLRAFESAMDSGIYDAVEYADGSTREAYATTNVQEYFAELSEAWFWSNDFYPFARGDLLEHDPVGAAAVEEAWAF